MNIRKHKLLALVTMAITVPALLVAATLIIEFSFPFTDWLFIEKVAIILSGLFGGVLLFKDKKLGYVLSAIAWALIFVQSCSSIYYIYMATQDAAITSETSKVGFFKSGFEILLSTYMLVAIIRLKNKLV